MHSAFFIYYITSENFDSRLNCQAKILTGDNVTRLSEQCIKGVCSTLSVTGAFWGAMTHTVCCVLGEGKKEESKLFEP